MGCFDVSVSHLFLGVEDLALGVLGLLELLPAEVLVVQVIRHLETTKHVNHT